MLDTSGNEITPDETFVFDITLSYTKTSSENSDFTPFLTGTQAYGDASFTWSESSGTYTATSRVTLKAGETITLSDIPVVVSFSVTEIVDDEDYASSWGDGTTSDTFGGTIQDLPAYTEVVCTNTEQPPAEPEMGQIKVSKNVLNYDGTESDDTTEFSFRAVFSGLGAEQDYTYLIYRSDGTTRKSATFTSLSDGSALADFTLADDEYASFDLPIGATYQILEYAAEGCTASYKIEGAVTVSSSQGENFEPNENLNTAEETLDASEKNVAVTVEFTNTLPKESSPDYMDISVRKDWADGNDVHKGTAVKLYLYRAETQEDINEGYADLAGTVELDGVTDESEDVAWQYTFTNLERYSEDGVEYIYTVKESVVSGYSADITQTTNSDGSISFTVTNEKSNLLPSSGAAGFLWIIGLGGGLIAVGASLLWIKRYRRKREAETG